MNQSELKEAVNKHIVRPSDAEVSDLPNATMKYILDLEEVNDVYKALAQQYLDIKDFPKDRTYEEEYLAKRKPYPVSEYYHLKGFNEALHLCKLAQMKKLEGLEMLIEPIISKWFPSDGQVYEAEQLAQAIRQHMGGK